jgi:uncharacterized membrane protein YphA (DoxX/SURF4 family)
MLKEKYSRYIDDLPRYGLVVVFLWFGIDKFILHDFYVNWLTATERVKILLPIQDLSLSIYAIGVAELVLGALLFTRLKIRLVCFIVSIWLILILSTAQYPSSFPQDLGLLGIAIILTLSNATWKNAYTERFLNYLWILRYSIATVFFLWAADYLLNYKRHIGWMQLFSPLGRDLPANELLYLIIFIALVEIVIGIMIALSGGTSTRTKYALASATIFLISAIIALDPPASNHQSIGLAFSTTWLTYLAFSKTER